MGSSSNGIEKFPLKVGVGEGDSFSKSQWANELEALRGASDYDIEGVRRADKWFDNRDEVPLRSSPDGYNIIAEGRGPDDRFIYEGMNVHEGGAHIDSTISQMVRMLKALDGIRERGELRPDQEKLSEEIREYLRRRTGS